MKVFDSLEVHEAEAWAACGRVALHLHNIVFDHSPRCFRDAVRKRREPIGHLLDQNKERLVKKAKSLGVRVIYIDREDQPFQHIDLCGRPLQKLIDLHFIKLLAKYGPDKGLLKCRKVQDILSQYKGTITWGPP